MNKLKKIIVVCIIGIFLLNQNIYVYAQNNDDENVEWYDMVEEDFQEENGVSDINPYTLYIMNVKTSLAKLSTNKVGLRADVYCTETMSTINIIFYLQKKSGSTWKNVSQGTASATNVLSTAKQATVSGLTSGTYRAKTVTKVVANNGYAETLTSYSGAMTI